MSNLTASTVPIDLPKVPLGSVKEFIPYLSKQPDTPVAQLLEPYKAFEAELRKVYAQQPSHQAVQDGLVNLVPVFAGRENDVNIRARNLDTETEDEAAKYIMTLKDDERKSDGAPAIVSSLKDFQQNFNLFSECSLADLDWSNVIAAGSAVTTALLPVPEKWAESKKSQREYYHEYLAPASDVDLFIYGLDEKQAIKKIKQIEQCVKDTILHETTTIRTKNAITIASQYPTRHVQIVLRLYDSISQILTGFDVDCACVAYSGDQVYAAPRALAAFVTQCNTVDLKRRSPSYENRLSKYSHRGFEVHWPLLDRSRIDPTIFERSFGRTQGLARLLILEKLPKSADRDAYMDQRRTERGRPAISRGYRNQHKLRGNIKDQTEDEVAEWVEQEEVASYHTMTVPYGPRYTAAKINRVLYTQDLLLNAEWNQKDDREVYLHRHPCFFGTAEEVIHDCCGYCPVPVTEKELEIAEKESKNYVSGQLKFRVEDPGRQEIGSFNPITDDEWTTMAYVGDTARLCQAIVDGDLEHVQDWCEQEGVDVNRRDYTGRTPLHLAVMASTPEIVQCLIDHGARLIARLVDGRTALHIAAARGNSEMVQALMKKSLINEEEEEAKEEARAAVKKVDLASSDIDMDASDSSSESGESSDDMTSGFVKVEKDDEPSDDVTLEDSSEDPDVYDINVVAWDYGLSPLHMAILNGHLDVIELLVSEYGADILLPVKFTKSSNIGSVNEAILTMVLAMFLPKERAKEVVKLLLKLGATSKQADVFQFSTLHYAIHQNNSDILDILLSHDRPAALSVLNSLGSASERGSRIESPLSIAVTNKHADMALALLGLGAKPVIHFDDWVKVWEQRNEWARGHNTEYSMTHYESSVVQPIIAAAVRELPQMVLDLLNYGANPATLEKTALRLVRHPQEGTYQAGDSLLDIVQKKLKSLREFKEPHQIIPQVETLEEENFYTIGLAEGAYQHWSAVHDFRTMHAKLLSQQKENGRVLTERKLDGFEEKMQAIAKLITEFEKVEKALIEAGAKPFDKMHPGIPQNNNSNRWLNASIGAQARANPYATSLSFVVPDLNPMKKDAYLKLFDAVWLNDVETVKSMTLGMWSRLDEEPTNAPLRIAVQDQNGFNPFSLAVLRRHWGLARIIVDISQAQYHKEDGVSNRQRWIMRRSDSDDESDSNDEEGLPIYSDLIDDKFTIDNLGEVSMAVRSKVLPLTMIERDCRARYFLQGKKADTDHRCGLFDHAVETDDLEMFKFMLKLCSEQQALAAEDEGDQKNYAISQYVFAAAIRLGRTAILGEMIKATGVGIPLNVLIQKSGVEIKEKQKYYQGLSIGGKKRADWAQAPGRAVHVTEQKIPPLLQAAHVGSIESVEWFMSDAPMRRCKQFAEDHKKDKRIKTLNASDKGFDGTIENWLSAKSELILHCAILYNPSREKDFKNYMALIKHISSILPDTLEQKSADGWTPLHIAVMAQQEEVVSHLISLGADQRSRDKLGRNVIHHMVAKNADKDDEAGVKLSKMIKLFDRQAVKQMLVERSSSAPGSLTGSFTPLAYCMARGTYKPVSILEVLSEYSDGAHLEMLNGEGDLPLHVAVKTGQSSLTAALLKLNPTLLHRENATGRTALEMAREIWLASCVAQPPRIHAINIKWPNQYSDSIVFKPSSDFIVGVKREVPDSQRRTLEICEEMDGNLRDGEEGGRMEGARKRRLVSLFEANEVARRLADRETRRAEERKAERHFGKSYYGQRKGWDVISGWVEPLWVV